MTKCHSCKYYTMYIWTNDSGTREVGSCILYRNINDENCPDYLLKTDYLKEE